MMNLPMDQSAIPLEKRPRTRAQVRAQASNPQYRLFNGEASVSLDYLVDSTAIEAINSIREATDVTTVLQRARDAILLLAQVKNDVKRDCALTFDSIWNYIATLEQDNPSCSSEIAFWRQGIRKDLTTAKIDRYLSLAADTRQRMDRCTLHIQERWGVKPGEVLSAKYYQPGSTLSRPVLQNLSALSDVTTLETAQEVLVQAIEARLRQKATTPLMTDPFLKPRDVRHTCESLGVFEKKPEKRKIAPEARHAKRSRTASLPVRPLNTNHNSQQSRLTSSVLEGNGHLDGESHEPDISGSEGSVRR